MGKEKLITPKFDFLYKHVGKDSTISPMLESKSVEALL
jgi:hypothetical protein